MSEFYKNRFDDIFQINDSGDILKLSMKTGSWDVVSEISEADIDCTPCSSVRLNNIQLAIYFRKSESAEIAGGGRPFGKDFVFFNHFGQIYCKDENDNEYICSRDFMRPVVNGTVENNWEIVPSDCVYNKIQSLDSFFIKELELYLFETNDIEVFFKSFSDKVPHEVIEKLGALNFYLKKSYDAGISSGIDFIFYVDCFGRIYAKDEKRNEYICNKDYLVPIKRKTIKNTWKIVDKYYVVDFIQKHEDYFRNLANKKIAVQDLNLYISKKGVIEGITEDGREFRLSSLTGELEAVRKRHRHGPFWKTCSRIQAVKFQFKKREEYRSIEALNEYLKNCNNSALKKYGHITSKHLHFFRNDFGRIFAKDDNNNEYVCEENNIIPLVNKGNVTYFWEPVEKSQVLYMVKSYADMMRGICEKNQNLKDIQKYIKDNEKKELEKTGRAFGCKFRFFVNSVGHIFAKDENGMEYFCNPREMAFTKIGTIDEEKWDSILESDVLKYLK